MTGMRNGGKPGTRDYVSSGSNYGPVIELSAPGISIESTSLAGGYETGGSGTSYAAPHVVGVAALLLAVGADASDVRGILQDTAEDLGDPGLDEYFGYGLVDAQAAVSSVPGAPPRHTLSPRGKLSITWGKLKSR